MRIQHADKIDHNGDTIEAEGVHLGSKWLVSRNRFSILNGYVGIPQHHRWFEQVNIAPISSCWPDLRCSSKIGGDRWIGFCCGSPIEKAVPASSPSEFPPTFDLQSATEYCEAICRSARNSEMSRWVSLDVQPMSLYDTSKHSETLRAEAALCAWEYALQWLDKKKGIPGARLFNRVDRGTAEQRHLFIAMAPSILAVYDELNQELCWDLPYDFEIVPEIVVMLDYIVGCLEKRGTELLTINRNYAAATARAVEQRLGANRTTPAVQNA